MRWVVCGDTYIWGSPAFGKSCVGFKPNPPKDPELQEGRKKKKNKGSDLRRFSHHISQKTPSPLPPISAA